MIKIDADLDPLAQYIGIVDGVTAAVESDIYINYFLNHTLDKLRERFVIATTAYALSNPSKMHHVYEWNSLRDGTPIPLFRLDLRGRGKSRHLDFRFVQSRRTVPQPETRKKMDKHIFRFKAIVMETGSPVVIKPKKAKMLFIPSNDPDNKRGYVMVKEAKVKNPGGKATTGAFSSWWAAWFNTDAEYIVNNEIVPYAENQIKESADSAMKTIRRGSSAKLKEFTVRTVESSKRMAEHRVLADAGKVYDGYDEDDEVYDE